MKPGITRRAFGATAGAAVFSAITSRKSASAAVQPQNVVIHPSAEIATVSPMLHSSFAEHLGSCVYGGLWVGKNSSIPNIEGFRTQAVNWLKELGVPVLRWPGGCFADDYHWRDGIGPLEKRPKTVNIHWGNYVEDNSFGTHEFIRLCRLIGSEPYLAANLGSGTPEEMREWMEYCNYPSGSSLSDERAANGSPEPFKVRYWGVGNENWGCGGNMTGDEYATHYKRFHTYARTFGDTRPFTIACGPNRNDVDWTRRFMSVVRPSGAGRGVLPSGYAFHYYQNGRDLPTKFSVEALQEQLALVQRMEETIVVQRGLLDSYLQMQPGPQGQRAGAAPPQRPQVQLICDEWGVWDRMDPAETKKYGALWMQSTMRSAVIAALGLNAFHRHADKLYMCNIAQTVNVLQSVILAHEDKCVRTTSYYAFLLEKPHRGNTAVRVETGSPASPDSISVSASKKDNELVVTFVNPKHDTDLKVTCALPGATPSAAKAQILHHKDHNACNTFEQPNTVVPKDYTVAIEKGRLVLDLPAMAIVTATVRLSA